MFRSNWFRRVTVALLIPSLGGCAGWHPFKLAPSLDDDAESKVTLFAGGEEQKLAYAASLNQAFAAANEQRNLYLDRVNEHHAIRSSASVVLYALSAWVVYKGLVSDSASSRRNIALGTATGAATYALGNWFTNPQQEAAYLQGFRGITCAMWQVRPYLVPAGDYSQFLKNRITLENQLKKLDSTYEELRLAERQFREVGNETELSKIATDFRLAERTRRRAHSTLLTHRRRVRGRHGDADSGARRHAVSPRV